MKIALGTANLGQLYGIANKEAPSKNDSIEIIQTAYYRGIRIFDTAPDYGKAEEILAEALPENLVEIQTKIPSNIGDDLGKIRESLKNSLKMLKVQKMNSVLFHNPQIYRSKNFPYIVEKLIEDGLTAKVGISCYTQQQVLEALEATDKLACFQLPENILDQRINNSSEISDLVSAGYEFQVRSIFLQGLLLFTPDQLPKNFVDCQSQIIVLHQKASEIGISVLQLCLSYAFSLKWASSVLVGANSNTQINEVIQGYENIIEMDWDEFQTLPEPYIDPRNWANLV